MTNSHNPKGLQELNLLFLSIHEDQWESLYISQ